MPVKNEALFLGTSLSALKKIVDEIIILDDSSSDNSVEIANTFGCYIFSYKFSNEKFVDMSFRRQLLLNKGREHGGTHFVWLDGDESFSANFLNIARKKILDLKPGQKMLLLWVTLWKTYEKYVVDNSAYAGLFKDFVVCDKPNMSFNKNFLSESRTPSPTDEIVKISPIDGVVLHFQFISWYKNQLKQAWYRCSELIEGSRSAKRINNTYRITLDDKKIKTKEIPKEWIRGLIFPDGAENMHNSWHFNAILNFFDKYGIQFFEPLQIWHIDKLHYEFLKRTGREPKIKTFCSFLVYLNDIKNNLKNKI